MRLPLTAKFSSSGGASTTVTPSSAAFARSGAALAVVADAR